MTPCAEYGLSQREPMKPLNPIVYAKKYPRTKTPYWLVKCELPGKTTPYQRKHSSLEAADRDRIRLIREYSGGGVTVDQARDVELAQRRLETCHGDARGKTILDAVEYFIAKFKDHANSPLVSSCIESFKSLHLKNKRAATIEEYGRYFTRLKKRFGKFKIADLNRQVLKEHVAAHPSPGPHRKCLVAFFGFCSGTSRKLTNETPWIRENEARWIPVPVKGADREIVIFNIDEVKNLLALALLIGDLPYWIWSFFTGMRPDEARKFWTFPGYGWNRVNLAGNYIIVNSEIAKDKRRRKIIIRPNLKRWLLLFKQSGTQMYPPNHHKMFREIKSALLPPEICRIRDLLRHTFVSFRVAAFDKSLAATAAESGNSEAIILAHYLDIIADQLAVDEFWGLVPSDFGLPEADSEGVEAGELVEFEPEAQAS